MKRFDSLKIMRINLRVLSCLALLGSGCQLFKAPASPDSLDNASSRTWTVTASFASGPAQTHEQAPESFFNFGEPGTEPRRLVKITAVSKTPDRLEYSLTPRELSILRQTAPGALMLVIYDEGMAALSPEIKKVMEQELFKNPYDRQEYFRLLKVEREPALQWTRQVLGRKQ